MTIKSTIAKVASFFKTGEAAVVAEAESMTVRVDAAFQKDVASIISQIPKEPVMPEITATPVDKVAAAIQIALALRTIDPSLSAAAVQAGTVAALSALYPVAVA